MCISHTSRPTHTMKENVEIKTFTFNIVYHEIKRAKKKKKIFENERKTDCERKMCYGFILHIYVNREKRDFFFILKLYMYIIHQFRDKNSGKWLMIVCFFYS